MKYASDTKSSEETEKVDGLDSQVHGDVGGIEMWSPAEGCPGKAINSEEMRWRWVVELRV
jgi:hypothetical protein